MELKRYHTSRTDFVEAEICDSCGRVIKWSSYYISNHVAPDFSWLEKVAREEKEEWQTMLNRGYCACNNCDNCDN